MEAIRQQLPNIVGRLSPWQRAAAISLLVVLIAVAGVVVFAQRPVFEPLYGGLAAADAADVISRLEEEGIPYRLAAGGKTVMVPREDVHRLRLMLAADGMPSGGVVGMELLDRFQFGATEFERRMNFLRALQGELTRTIRQIAAVEDARVHIVLPEDSLFISERQPASAAVLLTLQPGRSLQPEQIAAITYLVAGSVDGLDPSHVTVIDNHGGVLSSPLTQPADGFAHSVSVNHMELQQQFQSELQHSLQALLQQVFGHGNVATRVNAELNFDQSVIDRELFTPADTEGLLRSVQELEERFEGSGDPAMIPGTDANLALPTYAGGAFGQDSNYERNESVRNYELNQIRESIVVAPGTVKRLSVSVVINEQLTPEQLDNVRATVAAAIGFDPERNDQISVISMPFNTSIADEMKRQAALEQEAARQAELRRTYAAAAAAVLALLVIVVLLLMWRRANVRRQQETLLRRRLEAEIAKRQSSVAYGSEQSDEVQDRMETLVRQQPEQVAQIVRSWLVE